MKKITFFTTQDAEQFHSVLPLMKELIKRGDEVDCYSFDVFKELIEDSKVIYHSLDSYVEKEEKNTAISSTIENLNITKNCIQDLVKEIENHLPDYILVDRTAYWGKLIAKKYDISYTAYTSSFLINRYTTKYSKNNVGDYIQMALGMSKTSDIVKEIQQLGYIMNNPLNFLQVEDEETLVFILEAFQPYAETFGKNYHFVGPIKELLTVEKRDEEITIGIGNVEEELFNNIKEACIEIGIKYVEHNEKNVSVFISKGNMEEVNDCIVSGVPLILYPESASEKVIAQRVVELGIGAMLRSNTIEDIKQTIPFILNNPQYKKHMNELSNSTKQIQMEDIIQILERKD